MLRAKHSFLCFCLIANLMQVGRICLNGSTVYFRSVSSICSIHHRPIDSGDNLAYTLSILYQRSTSTSMSQFSGNLGAELATQLGAPTICLRAFFVSSFSFQRKAGSYSSENSVFRSWHWLIEPCLGRLSLSQTCFCWPDTCTYIAVRSAGQL